VLEVHIEGDSIDIGSDPMYRSVIQTVISRGGYMYMCAHRGLQEIETEIHGFFLSNPFQSHHSLYGGPLIPPS
jgi:hypothetical protein